MDLDLKALFGFSNRNSLKNVDLIIPLAVNKGGKELFYVVEHSKNKGNIVSTSAKDLEVAKAQKNIPVIINLKAMTEKGIKGFQAASKDEALNHYYTFLDKTNTVRAQILGVKEPIKNDFVGMAGKDVELSSLLSAYTGLSVVLGVAGHEIEKKHSAESGQYSALSGLSNQVNVAMRKLEIAEKLPQLKQDLIEKISKSADIIPEDKHKLESEIAQAGPSVSSSHKVVPGDHAR